MTFESFQLFHAIVGRMLQWLGLCASRFCFWVLRCGVVALVFSVGEFASEYRHGLQLASKSATLSPPATQNATHTKVVVLYYVCGCIVGCVCCGPRVPTAIWRLLFLLLRSGSAHCDLAALAVEVRACPLQSELAVDVRECPLELAVQECPLRSGACC